MKKIFLFLLVAGTIFAQSSVPQWAKGIVWYQIFPERFANGDTTNDPAADKVFTFSKKKPANWKVTPWTSDWFKRADWEKQTGESLRDGLTNRRYGGDIQGIINKLDYLKKLGIGAIYLNPVFDAVSMHKYDASTYHHIDINFGPDPKGDKNIIESEIPDNPKTWKMTSADKLFVTMLEEAHKRNIKVIIDGVFNHTGVSFWAFQDIVKNQQKSKYASWYKINSFKDENVAKSTFDYKGWWNIKSLPEFNRTAENLYPEVKDYIFAITKKWMDPNGDGNPSDGVDGWRLDVAREVPLGFWKDWHEVVKTTNPLAIIVGELWELSPEFVGKNGSFDALMNYSFATAVNDFFVAQEEKISADTLIARLKIIDKTYPADNLFVLQNLISSHDTERPLSMLMNPDRKFNRDGDEKNPFYNPGKPKQEVIEMLKVIAAFQMTYRGAPMIYYGDEVGMWGANDPHDRKPMLWDELSYEDEHITAESGFRVGFGEYKVKPDAELRKFYHRMIAMRNKFESLRTGTVEFLPVSENKHVFGFKRKLGDETILAVFNLSNQSEIFEFPVDTKEVLDLLVGDKVKLDSPVLKFILWGKSVAIYKI